MIVVNYGSDGSKTTIFDQIRNFKNSEKDIISFSKSFKELDSYDALDELIDKFPNLSKEIKQTAIEVSNNTKSMADFDNACNQASSASAEFAAKLKSIAANVGVMIAINLAVKAIQTAWDAWNETVEESQAKVDNINSKLEDLNKELLELKNLQDKDEYDHLRIQQLETEIALQKQLLEIEQKRLYQNQIGTSFSDYFDGDSLVSKKTQEENRYNKEGYEYLSDQYDKNEAELRKANEKIAALNNSLSVAETEAEKLDILESLNDATEKRNKLLEEQIEVADQLTVNSADYLNNYQLAQEAIESGLLTGSDLAKAKEMAEYWSQMYFNSLGMVTNIQKRNGTYDSSGMIKDILAKADFQDASKQLEELGKSGELSIATLTSRFPELIEYLDRAGISAQELYQYIMALSNPDAINYDNVRKQFMSSLGFGDTIDSASEAQLWNEIFSLGEEELVLEAYLKVRDQYGEHPEGWNAKDWISHIQSELENELIEIDTQLSISETIDQLNTRLKPAFDSLQSAWQDIFTDDGFTLENVGVDMLNSIKSTIDELNSMEGVDINIDSSAFEEFARVLSDTSSTAEDVQNQFNQLSNTIVRATSCTEVNSETFDVLTKSLEEMGLVNAREVLEEIIRAQEEFQTVSEQLGLTLEEVANATYEETVQMLIEAQAAGQDTQALWQLAVAQGTITDGTIATESNVDALLAEAQAAGLDAAMLTALENVRNGNIKDTNAAQAILEQTRQELQASMSSFKLDFDFSPAVKSAGKAGKESGKSYKDALKEELSDLDSVISGITSRIDANISSINSQKSAALDSIDAQKEALEEAKDAAVEALKAERDAQLAIIEEQRKALEKQIKQKQDEIDKINEAANAKRRENELMLAQYNLEKMMNQRTKLVK